MDGKSKAYLRMLESLKGSSAQKLAFIFTIPTCEIQVFQNLALQCTNVIWCIKSQLTFAQCKFLPAGFNLPSTENLKGPDVKLFLFGSLQ